MDSISLDWETAHADPREAARLLGRVEKDIEDHLAQVRGMRERLEELAARAPQSPPAGPARAGAGARDTPRPGPAPGATVPRPRTAVPPADAAGGPAQGRAPWRVRVLEVVRAGGPREWTLRELSERSGQPNQRSLRVTVEEMVDKGELAKRTLPPRFVRYRLPAHAPEGVAVD
ncbi:hypothetical protein ACFVZ3_39815 [Kitasatospora purpeofusca]|uniref:hypothetical protein n=1 Tax=Kitasatospora purpeofusca TaxID=67352 RepID=UPI003652087F